MLKCFETRHQDAIEERSILGSKDCHFDFSKNFSSTKLGLCKDASKARVFLKNLKNYNFESKNTKIRVLGAILDFFSHLGFFQPHKCN
jgi:hypothetical protein